MFPAGLSSQELQTSVYLLYQDPSRGSAIIDISRFGTWKPEAVPGNSPGACLKDGVGGTFENKSVKWSLHLNDFSV